MDVAYETDWRSLYCLTIVAFLGALKIGGNANLWPYLTVNDPTITESFFGYLLSISSFANLGSAFLVGWLSNQIQHTK